MGNCFGVARLLQSRCSQIAVTDETVWDQRHDLAEHLCGLFRPPVLEVKRAKSVVSCPVIRPQRNCRAIGFLGLIQAVELFASARQSRLRGIERRFNRRRFPVFFSGLLVLACALVNEPQACMTFSEPAIASRGLLTGLGCFFYPLIFLCMFVLPPICFAEPCIRSAKSRVFLKRTSEHRHSALYFFFLSVVL